MNRGRAAGAALLLAVLVWSCVSAARPVPEYPHGVQMEDYSSPGEILAHGIRALPVGVSYRMPLATLTAARVKHHPPVSPGALKALYRVCALALLVALGCLLHPAGALVSGAAAVLLLKEQGDELSPGSGFYLIVLLTACLLVWRAREPTPRRTFLLALAIGAGLLYRTPLAFFPPVLALWEWRSRRLSSPRAVRTNLAILCVVPYLFLLPWIGMNWALHRQLVPFEKEAADANVVAGALGLIGSIEGDLGALIGANAGEGRAASLHAWAAGEVLSHPARYAGAVLRRVGFALSSNQLLAFGAVLSFWLFRRRREFQELALLSVYFLGIHCLMGVQPNYFEPLWPLLAVAACAPLALAVPNDGPRPDPPEHGLAAFAVQGALGALLLLSLHAGWTAASFGARTGSRRHAPLPDLDRAVAAHPDDAWLRRERGYWRLAEGRLEDAEEDLVKAAALEPANPEHRLRLAWIRALQGRPAALLRWRLPPWDRSKPNPQQSELEIESEILKACALLREGRPGRAGEHLGAALELHRARHVYVGGEHGPREREILGRLRAAESSFARYSAAVQGDRPLDERLSLSSALTALLPGSVDVWIRRAALLDEAGRSPAAREALARAEALAAPPAGR